MPSLGGAGRRHPGIPLVSFFLFLVLSRPLLLSALLPWRLSTVADRHGSISMGEKTRSPSLIRQLPPLASTSLTAGRAGEVLFFRRTRPCSFSRSRSIGCRSVARIPSLLRETFAPDSVHFSDDQAQKAAIPALISIMSGVGIFLATESNMFLRSRSPKSWRADDDSTFVNINRPMKPGKLTGTGCFSQESTGISTSKLPLFFGLTPLLFPSFVCDVHYLHRLQTWPGTRRRKDGQEEATFTARERSCKTLIFMGLLGHVLNLKFLFFCLISLLLSWTKPTGPLNWYILPSSLLDYFDLLRECISLIYQSLARLMLFACSILSRCPDIGDYP